MAGFPPAASAHLLIELLEGTPDFVSSATAGGRILYINPAGRELLGFGADEPLENVEAASLHPRWAFERVMNEAVPAADRGERWHGESALLTRHGREVPVTQITVAHRDGTGGVAFYSTIARDISEQKRREAGLRLLADASEVLYSSLDYERTLDAVARLAVERVADYCLVDVLGTDGTLRRLGTAHADPAMEPVLRKAAAYPPDLRAEVSMRELLGTGRAILIADTSDEWLHRVAVDPTHLELMRELAPRQMIMAPMIARGEVVGSLWLTAVRAERQFNDGDVALATELAQRAALAVDNARLYEDAQRALRARDDVLGIVAHDLRNPVGTIYMAVGLLAELLPPSAAVEQKQVQIIERSAQRTNRLIQDLLEVHRIEAGQLVVDPQLHSATELVDEAWEDLRPLAVGAQISLRREVAPNLPPVLADRDRVLQVFSNLVGNALKFTPAGGEITLRAEQDGAAIAFSVTDTGGGIPAAQLPRLFERFWQANRADRRGAGLGLAIVHGIVQAHGGTVAAESEVGVGTTIRFTIASGYAGPPVSQARATEVQRGARA
ncbi:MAG TPA: ATP-binding protein [Longimicrobium sp.]|nr:ATP-binding protein [Longimicrobium sp.]